MLNDPIVIDRYHCETAEAVVVSYPNVCIMMLYLQPLAAWSVNHESDVVPRHLTNVEDPHRRFQMNV